MGDRGTAGPRNFRVFYERKDPQHMLFCRETRYCRDLPSIVKTTFFTRKFANTLSTKALSDSATVQESLPTPSWLEVSDSCACALGEPSNFFLLPILGFCPKPLYPPPPNLGHKKWCLCRVLGYSKHFIFLRKNHPVMMSFMNSPLPRILRPSSASRSP